jgi:hypothetical protein
MGEQQPEGEVDIYRDTPVRLLGYANEVGEAFRALVHVRWDPCRPALHCPWAGG